LIPNTGVREVLTKIFQNRKNPLGGKISDIFVGIVSKESGSMMMCYENWVKKITLGFGMIHRQRGYRCPRLFVNSL